MNWLGRIILRQNNSFRMRREKIILPPNHSASKSHQFMSLGVLLVGLFLTPDQQGQRLMERGEFAQAAEIFEDPMRIGTAWYRAGEFKKAEVAFRELATPEADYNRGNCQIFQGQYEAAVKSFDRALQLKPDWDAALTNREIAYIRAKDLEQKGGDAGDQKLGADKMVFDKQKKGGQDTQVDQEQGQELAQKDMQSLWLRRVQTNPADFLEAKFSYQSAMQEDGSD